MAYADVLQKIPFEVLEDLDIIDESPNAFYLLKWAAKTLDFTKISTQTDLTMWLRDTIKREAQRLGISEQEYMKRFKGMVKFFSDPSLGLRTAREIQEILAEEMVEDLKDSIRTITDFDDIVKIYNTFKELEIPPLAPARYAEEFRKDIQYLRSMIAKVTRHPDYRYVLYALRSARALTRDNRYKRVRRTELLEEVARLRRALEVARQIRKDLDFPLPIHEDSLQRYISIFVREIRERPVIRRRRL